MAGNDSANSHTKFSNRNFLIANQRYQQSRCNDSIGSWKEERRRQKAPSSILCNGNPRLQHTSLYRLLQQELVNHSLVENGERIQRS